MKLNPEETMETLIAPLPYRGPDPETMAFLTKVSEMVKLGQVVLPALELPDGWYEAACNLVKKGRNRKIDYLAINREMHDGSY